MRAHNLINSTLKIVCLFLGVYLLVINIGLWAIDPELNSINASGEMVTRIFNNFDDWHNQNYFTFKGFGWFFERLESFPGFETTHQISSTWCNIIQRYNVTGLPVIDTVFAIMRTVSAPILLTGSLIVDVAKNVLWFLSFLWSDLLYQNPEGASLL